MDKALKYGWYKFETFDEREYNELKNFDKGDINVIIPNEVIAFSSPISPHLNIYKEPSYNKPEVYLPQFKRLQINTIFRFNDKIYDENVFKENGLLFYDYYFEDGSAPPAEIVELFIENMKKYKKGMGFHCKAGLGRTGTMIAIYMSKVYDIGMREAVAWIKFCRPGSINKTQYDFLLRYESNKDQRSEPRPMTDAPRFRHVKNVERAQSSNITGLLRNPYNGVGAKYSATQPYQQQASLINRAIMNRSRSTTPQMQTHSNNQVVGTKNSIPDFTPAKIQLNRQTEARHNVRNIKNWSFVSNTPRDDNKSGHINMLHSDVIEYADKQRNQQYHALRHRNHAQLYNKQNFITPFSCQTNNNPNIPQTMPSRNQHVPSVFSMNNQARNFTNIQNINLRNGVPRAHNYNIPPSTANRPQQNSRNPPLKSSNGMFKHLNLPLKNGNSVKAHLQSRSTNNVSRNGYSVPPKIENNPLKQKWL